MLLRLRGSVNWFAEAIFAGAIFDFYFKELPAMNLTFSMPLNEIVHSITGCTSLQIALISGSVLLLKFVMIWLKKKFQLAQTGIKMKIFNFIKELRDFLNKDR